MARYRCHMKTLSVAAGMMLTISCLLAFHSHPSHNSTTRLPTSREVKVQKGRGHPAQRERSLYYTHDNWPSMSDKRQRRLIPRSPFQPRVPIKWNYNVTAFLQRDDVRDKPPKIITWAVKPRYYPSLPEPVRMRVCPEMPCRMTTNMAYKDQSAALMWAGQIMREAAPPKRSHADQIYLFHNHEPQKPDWIKIPGFRQPAWRSAFNWTMTYRFDSDLVSLYGAVAKRGQPPVKNYTQILAKKTKMAAWLSSHCQTFGRREQYIKLLQKHMQVDAFGDCGKRCPRSKDDACFDAISSEYKFYLAFENAFCTDYISEKFFRYLEADVVVVARASNEYKNHAPPGIFVNTADFASPKELADYLLYLDANTAEYIKILQAKDAYRAVYEDYPIRNANGDITYMHYHYEAVTFCEMCRRLWYLDGYRKTVPNIVEWFDKGNCYPPSDLKK